MTDIVHVHASQCWKPRIVELELDSTELGRRRTLVSWPLKIDTRRRSRLEYRHGSCRRHVTVKKREKLSIPFSHFDLLVCTLQVAGAGFLLRSQGGA